MTRRQLPTSTKRSTRLVEFILLIGAFMIITGIFRLYLIRSGKLQFVFGFQKYFPWAFIGLGAFFIITTLLDR